MTKRSFAVLIAFLLLVCSFASFCLCGCGADVIELSPEEEAQWEARQIDLYRDVVLSDFSAETLDGKTVGFEDCFAGNKITMINIWGTFCSSCIEEMPEIVKAYNELPDKTNIITICTDAGDSEKNLKFAREVMDKVDAQFLTIIPDEQLKTDLTDRTDCFPTTIFVDETGKTVGTPYMGNCEKEGYLEAIRECMKAVEHQ